MIRTCEQCGRYFKRVNNAQRYCCAECAKEGNLRTRRELQRLRRKRAKEEMQRQKGKTLTDIAEEASKAGMTYGKYVAKYGL